MKITIIKKDEQAYGEFNGGEIIENKPIGFRQDGGGQMPYSNLFYWAHATANIDSTIGLHPHQGFEICTFIFKGTASHYDTANKQWFPLEEGSAQIIRSGNGIAHSEAVKANSSIFQIWFDPNLKETLSHNASYNDYKSNEFPVLEVPNGKVKVYKGDNAPIEMFSPDVTIKEYFLNSGKHKFNCDINKTYSVYIIEGNVNIGADNLIKDDFFYFSETNKLDFELPENSRLFIIETPTVLNYKTYYELYRRS
jgi:redox-sensitive bicupin YhaK (pirin superfamily)